MTFLSNLGWRFATQHFNGASVDGELSSQVLDAIRMAPSSFGLQPYHITVVRNSELQKALRTHAFDQAQITDSSHVLVFSIRTDINERISKYFDVEAAGEESLRQSYKSYEESIQKTFASMDESKLKHWATHQTYIALGFALAACAELQLDSCPIEGFDVKAVRETLHLPMTHEAVVMLCVGYRDPSAKIRPKVRFATEDLFTLL
ncbi:MAG: hypothetical protein RL094_107 [Candidatus Parcubacteria bacterium]|jgi:nitroreductase